MSGRDLRRRATANQRAISNSRAPRPSPSPSPASARRIRPTGGATLWRPSENVKVLKRSKSEPSLPKSGYREAAVAASLDEDEEEVLYRHRTCMDIFSSPDNSVPRSPANRSEVILIIIVWNKIFASL